MGTSFSIASLISRCETEGVTTLGNGSDFSKIGGYTFGPEFQISLFVVAKKERADWANPVSFSRARLSQSYPEKNQVGFSGFWAETF